MGLAVHVLLCASSGAEGRRPVGGASGGASHIDPHIPPFIDDELLPGRELHMFLLLSLRRSRRRAHDVLEVPDNLFQLLVRILRSESQP